MSFVLIYVLNFRITLYVKTEKKKQNALLRLENILLSKYN